MKSSIVSKSTFFLFLFFGSIWMACGDCNPFGGNNDFAAAESFSFEVVVVNHAEFKLNGIAGAVVVTGVSGANSVLITGKRRVESHSAEDAQQRLQDLRVSVEDLNPKIEVKTIQPQDTQGRNYIVDYTITLPAHLEVGVGNISGNVTINTIQNDVSLNSVSGNVTLNDIVGSTFTETVSGNVEGRITLPLDGTIRMNAVSGNILLTIPQNTSALLSATVVSGSISVSGLLLQNLVSTPNSLSGRAGDGRGTISLNAVSGNISVRGV